MCLTIIQETKELQDKILRMSPQNSSEKSEQCESSMKFTVKFESKRNVENEIFKLKLESCKLKNYKVRLTSICNTFPPKKNDNLPTKV